MTGEVTEESEHWNKETDWLHPATPPGQGSNKWYASPGLKGCREIGASLEHLTRGPRLPITLPRVLFSLQVPSHFAKICLTVSFASGHGRSVDRLR